MDTDFILIRKMRRGDEAAIETFVRKHYPSILRYCRCHTWDHQLAEDLTQETFERFFRSFSSYHHTGKLANYLYVIARNLCRDSCKTQSKQQELQDSEVASMSDLDRKLDIRQAVDRLPEELREVIILHYFMGLKQREIAQVSGIGLPLVKYRLKRGKELLRNDLGEEEYP